MTTSPVGGKFVFDDGGYYCGGWADGKAHGHGICSGPQGQGHYDGSWNHGFETSGSYTWPNGNVYVGEWGSGKRQGLGEEVKGRWVYRGEWTHGFKGRYGVRQSTTSGACYAGTWTTGLQDGYGVEIYVDGGSYRGQWLQSMRHGFGIRQSVAYGLAVRYRAKAAGASKSSMLSSSSDQEDGGAAAAAARRRREEGERGGFVLLGRADASRQRGAAMAAVGSGGSSDGSGRNTTESRIRRTLARLRKQRSTSDLSPGSHGGAGSRASPGMPRHRTPDGSMRSQRASSEEYEESIHTDSCNASFISQDDICVGGKGDLDVVETYAGEWKNDKRSGFGVCERNDGLKYEGEWFNNKKNGYGTTTFQDGSVEEGKYKENELIVPLGVEKAPSGPHLFTMKQAKLRDRIISAVSEALHASQIAHQKTDIANARESNAKSKAELAVTAANKARADAELARQMAARCENTPLHPEILQLMSGAKAPTDAPPGVVDLKSDDVTGDRRQSRSMSIFARAFGKGTDSRRPSTVAAVFHAATSTLRQTPSRWSRRSSSVATTTADNNNVAMTTAAARKAATSNSVTWKHSSRDRLSSESPDRDPVRLRRGDGDVTSPVTMTMTSSPCSASVAAVDRSNHVSARTPVRSSRAAAYDERRLSDGEPDAVYDRRNNTAAVADMTSERRPTTTNRRGVLDDDPAVMTYDDQLQQQQPPASYDSRRHPDAVDVDSEERDVCPSTLSSSGPGRQAARRPSPRAPGNRPAAPPAVVASPRRLTLPSIVKYTDQSTPPVNTTGSGQRDGVTSRDQSSSAHTYVIINGERRRVAMATDANNTSPRRHISSLAESRNDPSSGSSNLDLPSRYSLEPVRPTVRRTQESRSRGSLPDVSAPLVGQLGAAGGQDQGLMSREEAHLLSQRRREELRLLREENERRRKFEIILSLGTLREWSSQRQLLIIVVAINVSLAAVFWNLLRHS